MTSFCEERGRRSKNPIVLPGLNLAQVCILFFLPSSRQLNLSANRKTKENVFSEAPGNSAPQATETLKCFHSVLSGVLSQSQIMRNTGVSSRGHMSASISLPFLGLWNRNPTRNVIFPSLEGDSGLPEYLLSPTHLFWHQPLSWGIPPLLSLLLISHHVGRMCFPHSTVWFCSLCKYLLSNYCMVSTKIYSVE